MRRLNQKHETYHRYFVFSESELIFLTICVILDVSEYVVAILLLPVVGDIIDIVGIAACFFMFRWVGILSLFELVPGADILPIFIITWLVWYLIKKQRK